MSETKESGKQKSVNYKQESNKTSDDFPNLLGGIIFISAGFVLLLNNIGIITWSIWMYIFPFWPVIFIFIGLDIVFGNSGRAKTINTLIGLVILLLIFIYGLTASDSKFRTYIFRRIPIWKNIYQAIPKNRLPTKYDVFDDFPSRYRDYGRGSYHN